MAKKVANQASIRNLSSFVSPQMVHGNKQAAAISELQKEMNKTADTGGVFFSTPTPFQPEFGDPSKINFPIDRHQSNRYARLFYRCFLPGTPVVMADGTRKNIENIKEGEYVLTHNNVAKKVCKMLVHDVDEKVYYIYMTGQAAPIKVTSEHPFLVNDTDRYRYCACGCRELLPENSRAKNTFYKAGHYNKTLDHFTSVDSTWTDKPNRDKSDIKWKIADDLKVGDELLCKMTYVEEPAIISKDKAWLFGIYCAEGNLHKKRKKKGVTLDGVTFSLHRKEKDTFGKRIQEIVKKEYNANTSFYEYEKSPNSLTVRSYCKEFAEEAYSYCGEYSYAKKLNPIIFTWPKELLKEFIKGLFQGDGHFKNTSQPIVSWVTVSNDLSDQVRLLLYRIGVGSGKVINTPSPSQKYYNSRHRNKHIITVSGDFARELIEYIKEEATVPTKQKLCKIQKIDSEYISYRIDNIDKVKYSGPVYNLEVEDDHTYLVGHAGYIVHNCDPVIGSVIDMFAEMLTSDIDLYGEGVTGEIKRSYEQAINDTAIVSMFQYFIKEFLVVGEVIPHLIFDESKGIWSDLIFHNPDQVNVLSSSFLNVPTILEFVPDEGLRKFITSQHPQVLDYIQTLPAEIVSAIASGQNVPLNTKFNVSFLARKLFPYDTRGTSILPRVWQISMYESACFNSAIATARRHSGPLKICKLGSPEHQFIPPKEFFDEMVQQFTIAESDPHAMLVLPNYGIQFEAFGTTDRMMQISREYEIIERIKLTALGVSQGFLHGDASWASSKTNMNTLLMRLKGMRKFFEAMWFQNKFFKPLAEINEWQHRSTAEVNHRVRIKKNANEQRLIVPKIKWRQLLEPVVDKDMLEAIRLLNDLGVKSSKTTSFAAAGLDFEGETVNALTEQKIEKQLRKKILPEDVKDKRPEDIAEEILPGGAAPLSMPDELPMTPMEGELPEAAPAGLPPEGEATTPEEAAEAAPGAPPITPAPASKQAPSKRGFKVNANDVDDLIDLMETGKTESQIWSYIKDKEEDNNEFIKNCNWDRINDYMEDEDFSNAEIEYVRKALVRKHIIEASLNDKLEDAVETLNLAAATDAELHSKIDKTISDIFKDKIAKIQEKVKEQDDAFLTGEGNIYSNNDFLVRSGGDLSDKAIKKYRKMKKK